MTRVVVLGAGLAGLGAALQLRAAGLDVTVLEREDGPGGLARSARIAGFSFDRTGHFLHSRTPDLQADLESFGVRFDEIERCAALAVGDAIVPYPLQYNLWALPPEQRIALDDLAPPPPLARPPETFGALVDSAWGPALSALFFRPYNRKLWGRSLDRLPADCAGPYLPTVDWDRVRAGCLSGRGYEGYNHRFLYPSSGRIGEAPEALASRLGGDLRLNFEVGGVDLVSRHIRSAQDDEVVPFDELISTIPLPALSRLLGRPPASPHLFDHTSVRNLRVGVRGRMLGPQHWLYVPDPERSFYRVGFPANVNPRTCPEGCVSLSIECGPAQLTVPAEAVVDEALRWAEGLSLIEVEELLLVDELLIRPAYVVHRSTGRAAFAALAAELGEAGVHLAGRYGSWEYLSMDEAYKSGKAAADRVLVRLDVECVA